MNDLNNYTVLDYRAYKAIMSLDPETRTELLAFLRSIAGKDVDIKTFNAGLCKILSKPRPARTEE